MELTGDRNPAPRVVVAALLERNGTILICRRAGGQPHAGKWEFPGGKVEPGEALDAALRRELREELDIRASIGEEVERYEFAYPGKPPILLVFFRVTEFSGEPRNVEFAEIRWETPGRLPDYDFLEGDVDFVRRLAISRGNRRRAPG
jgi:8-oxo-dGTP diphosphatase